MLGYQCAGDYPLRSQPACQPTAHSLKSLVLPGCSAIPEEGLGHLAYTVLLSFEFSTAIACRFPALQHLDISACRRVSDEELASLPAMRSLRSVVLSGCEDISDEGIRHLACITQLSSLNMSNCCKVRGSRALVAAWVDLISVDRKL